MKLHSNKSKLNQSKGDITDATHKIFERVLKVTINEYDADFFYLGGDSLAMSELQLQLEDAFNMKLYLPELLDYSSINKMSKLIAEKMVTTIETNNILRPIRTEGSKPPLFVIHGLRGYAIISQDFIDIIDDDQPIYCLNARGFKGDECPFDNIPQMAQEYINEIKKVQAEGPYCFLSFCSGSVVLMEMTYQLLKSQELVAPLILIDPPYRTIKTKSFLRRLLIKRNFKLKLIIKYFDDAYKCFVNSNDTSLMESLQKNKYKYSQEITKTSSISEIQKNSDRFVLYFQYAMKNYTPKKLNIDVIRIFTPERDGGNKTWLKLIKGNYIEKRIHNLNNHVEIFNFANQEVIDNIQESLALVYRYLDLHQSDTYLNL